MNAQSLINIIKHTHVEEFPTECWEYLMNKIKTGGLAGLKEDKIHTVVCLMTLISYVLGKLNTKPIIGGEEAPETAGELPLLQIHNAMAATISIPSEGPIKNILLKQLLAMALSYLQSVLEDNEKVQEIFDQLIEWIKSQFA